jgi:chromate transporter
MNGIKPAVVAIVLGAAWRIGSRTIRNAAAGAIAACAFVAIAVLAALPAHRAGRRAGRLRGRALRPQRSSSAARTRRRTSPGARR